MNDNELEGQNSANEVVENDVHEGLSDNSRTITQPMDNVHNCPIYVEKFTFQVPSCGSSMKDDIEIDSSVSPFDSPLEWSFNSMRKVRGVNFLARIRRVAARIQSQFIICHPY